MAAPRLPFLWPVLVRNVEMSMPAVRSARAASRARAFHQHLQYRLPDAAPQRYGTANEPPPHLGGGKSLGPSTTNKPSADPPKALPKIGEQLQRDGEAEIKAEQAAAVDQGEGGKEAASGESRTPGPILSDPALDASESELPTKPPAHLSQPAEQPLEAVLKAVPATAKQADDTAPAASQAPSPAREQAGNEQLQLQLASRTAPSPPPPPHMDTPRYVHHFDTYGLVRRLVDAGWTQAQAITTMKAVRLMLAGNMELARDALVSKSQVGNETYLFSAACAELKTEVTGRRKAEQETLRAQRTQLQHELDILTQRVGQEAGALKDELKGMFDDRRMAVRNEQRAMESKIQRLNYQITVDLQADGKSEVEGLRWVMTRRVIIALAAVVVMVLGSLKIYSNTVHEQEMEAKRRAAAGAAAAPPFDVGLRAEESGGIIAVKEGDNPAFVSLG